MNEPSIREVDPRRLVERWEGDPSELRPLVGVIRHSHEMAELAFCSKQEAFNAGLVLGEWQSQANE